MLKKIRVSFGGTTQEFLVESQAEELTSGENKQLKDRINKAIKYIENTRVDNNYMVQEKYEYLLEILKGE